MNHQREQNKQARLLNEYIKTYIAPSDIQGVGVFAMRDLKKGESLYADMAPKLFNLEYKYFDDLLPEIKEYLLGRWPQVINGSAFGFPDTRIQAFVNHSDEPNYDAAMDILLKDVKKGEEITEDYKLIKNATEIFNFLNVV